MTTPAENEGFRVVDDFVCEAIHASDISSSHVKKSGRNEGVRLVGELIFEKRSATVCEDERCSENGSDASARLGTEVNSADSTLAPQEDLPRPSGAAES